MGTDQTLLLDLFKNKRSREKQLILSKVCTRSGFWWGSFNYAMRKGNLIIFLQNEQISIRNTREIHGIGPNSI